MIKEFRGKYFFLSNFYNATVVYEGLTYLNNEAAFQSAKTIDMERRKQFCNINPSTAKHKGRNLSLRHNWESIKCEIMYDIVKDKFTRHPDLKAKLLATNNEELVEGNTWGDTYWGVCNGRGKNVLGAILMDIRNDLKIK